MADAPQKLVEIFDFLSKMLCFANSQDFLMMFVLPYSYKFSRESALRH